MLEPGNLNNTYRPAHNYPRHPFASTPSSLQFQDIESAAGAGSDGAAIQRMWRELIDRAPPGPICFPGRQRAPFPVPPRKSAQVCGDLEGQYQRAAPRRRRRVCRTGCGTDSRSPQDRGIGLLRARAWLK